jgi:hypothetical protein
MKLLILAIVALVLFLMNPNREGLCDAPTEQTDAERAASCARTGSTWDPVAKSCSCST